MVFKAVIKDTLPQLLRHENASKLVAPTDQTMISLIIDTTPKPPLSELTPCQFQVWQERRRGATKCSFPVALRRRDNKEERNPTPVKPIVNHAH